MNWIDTPLLIYASIEGHPAREHVEQLLTAGTWGSSVLVLSEFYQVLVRDYAVAADVASSRADLLARATAHWAGFDLDQVRQATALQKVSALQSTDAVLLLLAREDRGILVTEDRHLLRFAEAAGIAVRNPITTVLATQVARWEAEHLPPKGLPRFLWSVERWLNHEDAELANRFRLATGQLTRLPT